MKRLLMIAALAVCGFAAKAQFVANGSPCAMEYREVCINSLSAPGCFVTSTGTWIPSPPFSNTPLAPGSCMPPDEVGYEVRYAACPGLSVIIKRIGSVACTGMNSNPVAMPPCAPCNGVMVHFNGMNMHIDPM